VQKDCGVVPTSWSKRALQHSGITITAGDPGEGPTPAPDQR